ncbi:MAG: MFS transporter [Hyphomicrobiaceae bacterium]|nr:MFS transporter [Hyphomicrobiaceae bacterium]
MTIRDDDAALEDVLDSRYSWLRMIVSFLIGGLGIGGIWSVVVAIPELQAEFGLDRAGATLAYISATVGFAIGNFTLGRFVDRYGIALPLLLGGIVLGAGFILTGLAPTFSLVLLLQCVIGLGASTSFSPLMADVSHWFLRRRGIAVSLAASGSYIGGVVWPLVVGKLITVDDWRLAYIVLGVICIVCIVPLSLLLRRRLPGHGVPLAADAPSGATRVIALSPAAVQWLLVGVGFAASFAMAMPHTQLVAMSTDLGFTITQGAAMMSLVFGGGVFSRLVYGLLADRLGAIAIMLMGCTGMAASLILFIPFDALWVLYLASLGFGLAHGGILPNLVLVVREFLPAREAGRRVGVVVGSTVVGVASGSWVFGFLRDLTATYEIAFYASVGSTLAAIAILAFLRLRAAAAAKA